MGTAVPTWTWVAFAAGITVLLVLDLRVLHRHPHALGVREAAIQSAGWITLGLAFGVVVLAWRGSTLGGEYFSAYLIEESLSIDNVFAWALILAHFAVPPAFQHRVLFWGIVGAIVLRVVFILGGVIAPRALRLDRVRVRGLPARHGRAPRVPRRLEARPEPPIQSGASSTRGSHPSPSCRRPRSSSVGPAEPS